MDSLRLVKAKRRVLNKEQAIQNAFSNAGLHKYKNDKLETWERTLKNLRKQLDEEERLRMIEALPGFIKKMKLKGEIFDEDFEAAGIPGSNKNGLCISHRRSVLMHHGEVLKREQMVADAKLAKEVETENKKRKRAEEKLVVKVSKRKVTVSSTSSNSSINTTSMSSSSSSSFFNSVI